MKKRRKRTNSSTLAAPDERVLLLEEQQTEPVSPDATRRRAINRRRLRVSILIAEEGLRRGTIVRLAYWLGVSPSTIRRDIEALLNEGDPTVTTAATVAARKKDSHAHSGRMYTVWSA